MQFHRVVEGISDMSKLAFYPPYGLKGHKMGVCDPEGPWVPASALTVCSLDIFSPADISGWYMSVHTNPLPACGAVSEGQGGQS